ncbi:hypothetical protein O181_113153 [Austropuccinia psidii MF-1]|uniref:Uncharacterized protein n=1 Tax=Austropuccinia psidii MF-1 TaxID=1389203 RepID=A0A9Q3PTC8_9BASI|nr:hypothetical protein [Austropuccinia psidii MF-1]
MTPTRSGSNYSIQSNGSGPGHSRHKSKRQECQLRGEAQMQDARTSTSSQRLASTFIPLIESPEAYITDIAVVRPESLSTGNNRDIPVSVQELVYAIKTARVGTSPKSLDRNHELISSSEEVHRSRKDRRTSVGLDTHVLQRTSQTDKSLVEKPRHVIRGPEEEVVPREGKSQVEAPQASTRTITPQQVPNKPKKTPKTKWKGKKKAKPKWNKPYPQNYRIPKKEKTAMDNVLNMARTLMEFKNKEEEILNQSSPKK